MMKQTKRCFALILAIALAMILPVMAAEDDFSAQLIFNQLEDGSPTVEVKDSPVLAQRKPTLTVDCSFEKAYVVFEETGKVVPSTLDSAGGKITFTVAHGGVYVIREGEAPVPPAPEQPDIITPVGPSKPTEPTEPSEPSEPVTPAAPTFNDVTESDWYYDGVKYVSDKGLMNGTGANTFAPAADTTRGMIVTILARMEGVNTSGGASWYALGSEWAMNAGVSDGTNMEGKITREQLAVMLYRYAKMKGYDVSASAALSGYTDASSVSSWAQEAMQWAVGSGLIQGSGSALNPQANASRAEVATILARFAQNLAK